MTAAEIDAVTIDAFGTLATLADPIPRLAALLPEHEPDRIAHAFRTEGAYYAAHVSEGRDTETLARLRLECVAVFNDALGSTLSVDEYVGALHFEPLPGVREALQQLRALGLSLAVVANWDFGIHAWLETLTFTPFFTTIIHAAAKPGPDGILQALSALRVRPERALHIGDDAADEMAARAAHVHFLPAPLPEAVASLV